MLKAAERNLGSGVVLRIMLLFFNKSNGGSVRRQAVISSLSFVAGCVGVSFLVFVCVVGFGWGDSKEL